MKRNKLVRGLCLAILAGLWVGGIAHATTSPQNPNNTGATSQARWKAFDPAQSPGRRHEMPLSARKTAAVRLKAHYLIDREAHAHAYKGGVK
jgi:hypothetical protein